LFSVYAWRRGKSVNNRSTRRPTDDDARSATNRSRRAPQFRLFYKLVLIVALSNLPVLLLGSFFINEHRKDTSFAEKERAGLAYLAETWPLFDTAIRDDDPSIAIARVEAAGARYDPPLRTGFYRAAAVTAAGEGGSAAVEAGHDFITRIADYSNLSVDPDLSTLLAINVLSMRIPEVAEAAYHLIHDMGGPGDQMEDSALGHFQRAARALTAGLNATDALNFEPNIAQRLTVAHLGLRSATDRFVDVAVAANEAGFSANHAALTAAHDEFQSALSVFWTAAVEALDMLMVVRIQYLHEVLVRDLSSAGGLLMLVMLLVWIVSRSITGRLAGLGKVMETMRGGHLDVAVPHVGARDEVGAMARAVEDFRGGLIEKRKVDQALLDNQRTLQTQNLRFDSALRHMSQGLAMFDRDGALIVSNDHFAQVYGIDPRRIAPGMPYTAIVEQLVAEGIFGDPAIDRIVDGSSALTKPGQPADSFVELADGRILYVSQRVMPEGGWVSTHEDITERQRAEAKIAYMAHHDALTGLPNRVLFKERLAAAAENADEGAWVAVLCLDLDNFKGVNDTLGHPLGDALLKLVAERLSASIDEPATVARQSGDEFAIVQPAIAHPDDAGALAQRLVEALAEPYVVDGHHVDIGVSIGIALAPTDGSDPDQLLKNADIALYRAKDDGRGTHRFFERAMDARLQARRALELDMRKALAEDQFALFYQAQVSLAENEVRGFEALIRWRHPARGLVSPDEFIPLAEKTGLIVPIGEWVLKNACAEAATWPDGIKVAVNLSPAQFRSRKLVPSVVGALASSGLAPSRLELEITESVLLQDNDDTLATLHQLRGLGVHISMDDFGTGYSSLSYLHSFPFDKIKIDRSFTRDLESKPDSAAIIRAVAGLGASLGMATTAEGVETPAQLEMVRSEGCTEVQGFVFSRPIVPAEIRGLLERFRPGVERVA